MKVMSQDIVCGMFTVTVDEFIHGKKNNDVLVDNYGREFMIKSIAMTNSHTETTFVLQPIDGQMRIGEYVS